MLGKRALLNFTYVIPHRLAGMACPGMIDTLGSDLAFLSDEGIGAVVSLTVQPLDTDIVSAFGMRYLHLPVHDFTAPSIPQVQTFVNFVDNMLTLEDRAVAVHCGAGCGRTGTMLACYLVKTGLTAPTALTRVRELRPGSVETPGQEACIYQYQEHLKF